MHGVAGEGLGVEQLSCDDRTYSSPGVFDDGLAALCLRNWTEGSEIEIREFCRGRHGAAEPLAESEGSGLPGFGSIRGDDAATD